MIYFYNFFSFIFGLAIGSFLNVCIWRTRENLSIIVGRSLCPHCRHQLAWYDNIPLVSFAMLFGKCRYCNTPISWQYPTVEFITGFLFLLGAVFYHGEEIFITAAITTNWFITSVLVFIFVYDFKYREILDRATLIPAVFIYLFQVAMGWHPWWCLLAGAGIGGGFFLIQYVISRGRWIGGGDIRLGVLMGVILGWPNIIMAVLMGYIIGAVFSLFLIAFKKKTLTDETPFGTYLAIATVIVMFWGKQIAEWYLGLLQ